MKPHWYYTETHACPVCGQERVYRERRYGKKPKDPRKRFHYDGNFYDHCLEM